MGKNNTASNIAKITVAVVGAVSNATGGAPKSVPLQQTTNVVSQQQKVSTENNRQEQKTDIRSQNAPKTSGKK